MQPSPHHVQCMKPATLTRCRLDAASQTLGRLHPTPSHLKKKLPGDCVDIVDWVPEFVMSRNSRGSIKYWYIISRVGASSCRFARVLASSIAHDLPSIGKAVRYSSNTACRF